MKRVVEIGRRFVREEDGIAVTEYGLLVSLVAVGLIAVLTTFRGELQKWFTSVTSKLTTAS